MLKPNRAGRTDHLSSQFSFVRAISDVNFNLTVESQSDLGRSASHQTEFWAAAAGAWVKV